MNPASILLRANSALDTQRVTCGVSGVIPDRQRGYSIPLGIGSISPGTSKLYGGLVVQELYTNETLGALYLTIPGTLANSGWTTMTVNNPVAGTTVFLRSAAAFTTGGGVSTWRWTGATSEFTAANVSTVRFT